MNKTPSIFLLRLTCACVVAWGLVALTANAADTVDTSRAKLRIQPAERLPGANTSMILAATLAGERIVAVGAHGVVLLSDDAGKSFRQARSVPVSSTLTDLSFADQNIGWAVGQWGVIIKTTDGGETWRIQRSDISVDQPLFSVYFRNSNNGWAVGLWSLMLRTTDGGAIWSTVQLPPPPGEKRADRNLNKIFADTKGDLFVACEQGWVLRSIDGGNTWAYLKTGYSGSFWTGVALQDGTLLVGGLRGTIYRSTNGGANWLAAQSAFKSSVTDIVQLDDRSVVAVALDGVSLISHDDGATFSGNQRPDRTPLTAVVDERGGASVVFSTDGPISQ